MTFQQLYNSLTEEQRNKDIFIIMDGKNATIMTGNITIGDIHLPCGKAKKGDVCLIVPDDREWEAL